MRPESTEIPLVLRGKLQNKTIRFPCKTELTGKSVHANEQISA